MRHLQMNALARLMAAGGGAPARRDQPCAVLTADPAWSFNDSLPGAGRGASKNYSTQYIDDIINRRGFEFEWPLIAENAILFLWRVASQVEEAYAVMRGWDFEPKSEMVWNKLTKNGKKWMGMGRTGRQAHEICIIGTRGRSALVMQDLGVRSTFEARVPTYEPNHPNVISGRAKAGSYVHSAKPEEFRDIVQQMCKGPYVELFGRRTRPGWSVRGNQVWDGDGKRLQHIRS